MYDELAPKFRRKRTGGRGVAVHRRHARGIRASRPGGLPLGRGRGSELAAAGKPSILVPFPFAADHHQLRNAEAFEKAGAARAGARSGDGRRRGCSRKSTQLRARSGAVAAHGRARRGRSRIPDAARARGRCAGRWRDMTPLTLHAESRNNTRLKCFLSPSTCTSSASAASA